MISFSLTITSLSPDYAAALEPVIAANWQ